MIPVVDFLTISRIAREAGVDRSVVRTLIDHYGVECIRSENRVVVTPDGLPTLIEALSRHPGVNPGFADRL
jgi:hypothetical protein